MKQNVTALIILVTTVYLLSINAQGTKEERISVRKCKEYKEFYRETFAPKVQGRDPILGKYKCPNNKRVRNPNLRRDVFRHEFPHVASLWYESVDGTGVKTGYKFRCSGTLISKRHVLVPGHCIYSKSGKPTHVTFGDSNLYDEFPDSKRQVLQVADIIFHPHYVPPSSVNDIAIVLLTKGVKYDERSRSPRPSVRPACLPVEGQEIRHGISLTAYESKSGSLITERVTLIEKNKDCEDTVRSQLKDNFEILFGETVRPTQFCSESLASNTCLSDIGGALTTQPFRGMPCIDTVVGFISVNATGCEGGSANPIVYTSVEKYLDWIEEVVWPKQFKSGISPLFLNLYGNATDSQSQEF
ncbi:unnamed protein product [Allacma fusca]|uniref:Peptidase S1 domain-containing protein n=1 Tax=Allacma fusca TaxID=39272 RepID=A0A8J2KX82_9HEXA|nr:unnamed protein product [Allacma fusca]